MGETRRPGSFDDPAPAIARLQASVERARRQQESATASKRAELGWWIWGATKQIGRLEVALEAQRRGEHIVVVHQDDPDGHVAARCSCGAFFRGVDYGGFSSETFRTLPGHRTWQRRSTRDDLGFVDC